VVVFACVEGDGAEFLNYSCAFYVLESDPAALAVLFHMHDLREVISQGRVRWFVRGSREEVLGGVSGGGGGES